MAFKFLTGEASAKAAVEAAAKGQGGEGYSMWRFHMKPKTSAKITFVDGDLAEEGYLQPPPRYYEHHIQLNNTWGHFFVCPQLTRPELQDKCPICESGDKPALVALFTVLDHRVTEVKGKVYKDQPRLYVAKSNTFDLLNKYASKKGGLTGWTVEVLRAGDKDPAVGSAFDFEERHPVAELKKLYTKEVVDPTTNVKSKVTLFTPADYEKEIEYLTGDELRAKLTPKAATPVLAGAGVGAQADYTKVL